MLTTGPGIPPLTREEVLARVRAQYSGDVVARRVLTTIEVGDSVAVAPRGSMPDRASDRRENSGSIAFGTARESLFRKTRFVPHPADGLAPFLAARFGLGPPRSTNWSAAARRIAAANRAAPACVGPCSLAS